MERKEEEEVLQTEAHGKDKTTGGVHAVDEYLLFGPPLSFADVL